MPALGYGATGGTVGVVDGRPVAWLVHWSHGKVAYTVVVTVSLEQTYDDAATGLTTGLLTGEVPTGATEAGAE